MTTLTVSSGEDLSTSTPTPKTTEPTTETEPTPTTATTPTTEKPEQEETDDSKKDETVAPPPVDPIEIPTQDSTGEDDPSTTRSEQPTEDEPLPETPQDVERRMYAATSIIDAITVEGDAFGEEDKPQFARVAVRAGARRAPRKVARTMDEMQMAEEARLASLSTHTPQDQVFEDPYGLIQDYVEAKKQGNFAVQAQGMSHIFAQKAKERAEKAEKERLEKEQNEQAVASNVGIVDAAPSVLATDRRNTEHRPSKEGESVAATMGTNGQPDSPVKRMKEAVEGCCVIC